MKKILFALLLMLSFVFVKAQIPQAPIIFNTVQQMINMRTSYTIAKVNDPLRGGIFNKVSKGALVVDSGIVMPSIDPNFVWVRDVTPSSVYNIQWWGAKGEGISSFAEDTVAFVNVFKFFKNKSGWKNLYVPSTPYFYCWPPTPIPIGDSINFYGDGRYLTKIINVAPNRTNFNTNPMFLTTTYTPSSRGFINLAPVYDIHDAYNGQYYVVLTDDSKMDSLIFGKVVGIAARFVFDDGDTTQPRYLDLELNEVVRKNNDTAFLKYPLGIDFITTNGEAPHIINMNNTSSIAVDYKNYPLINFSSKSFNVHDMSLIQADYDMIADTTFTRGLSGIFNPGACFECSFHDLYVEAYMGAIYGNMFTHTQFYNIDQQTEGHNIDMGYGSYDVVIYNNNALFKDFRNSDSRQSDWIINDGQHAITVDNNKFSGKRNADRRVVAISGVKNITITNNTINYPAYNANQTLFEVIDGGNGGFSKNIYIGGNNVFVDTVSRFMYASGDSLNKFDTTRNIVFNNNTFKGIVNNSALRIIGISGIVAKNMSFPNGGIVGNTTRYSTFQNLSTPNGTSDFGSDTTGTQVMNVGGIQTIAGFGNVNINTNSKLLHTTVGIFNRGFLYNNSGGYFNGNLKIKDTLKGADIYLSSDTITPVLRYLKGNQARSFFVGNGGLNTISSAGSEGKAQTGIGVDALKEQTRGYSNTAVGAGAIQSDTASNQNVVVGVDAASQSQLFGNNNTVYGFRAAQLAYNMQNNVISGYRACDSCYNLTNVVVLGQGSRNSHDISGAVAIGNQTSLLGNNTVNIKNGFYGTGLTGTQLTVSTNARFGVGIQAPAAKLHIAYQAGVPTLQLDGIQNGASSDSSMVINNGVVKKVASLITTTSTASGNGTSTTITVTLPASATWVNVQSANAASDGIIGCTVSGTTLSIRYTTAPASGTNNLSYYISYK